ncbi:MULTISPECIES: DUF2793 domain-containing protein [unclassified Hyphomicrobium]|uniref:DUF2793 domain-containing protein n=1 Tax=unclassified Hyphomicrobium TaxID=2619925 RepID=UPI0004B20465|nr:MULTISPECIES: DUF2793 domain-containing protein [unclassified Hyphomicrobium]
MTTDERATMTDTPNLALPYILPSQAQKHVTHNEAIRALDCLVQLAVESRSLAAPPASPAEGSRYLVAAAATGDWSGRSEMIAAFQDGAWMFYEPREGWLAWVADDHELAIYSAGAWAAFTSGGDGGSDPGDITELDDLAHVGINAAADTTNRLALKSPASLFDNAGNGHQQKINKHAAGDTASVLYQTNYSGRAEMGLAGDDDFRFKVSPDGASWYEALKIDRNTGKLTFPVTGGPREVLTANRTYYVRSDGSDSNNGLANTSGGAFLTIQKALDVVYGTLDLFGFNVTIQVQAGTWTQSLNVPSPQVGAGVVALLGDATTPSNVVISTAGACITVAGSGTLLTVRGFKLTSSSNNCLQATQGGRISYGKIEFGAASAFHLRADNAGAISCPSGEAFTLSGSAQGHLLTLSYGLISIPTSALTITGTPAWGTSFVSNQGGQVSLYGVTFSGSSTGRRYDVSVNGVINTFGAGSASTYFPGNVNGVSSTGGQQV